MEMRTMIGIGLTILILVGIVFVYNNKEEFFKNEATIVYPDGCVETYLNMVLTSEKCNVTDIDPVDKYNQYGDNSTLW